MGDWTWCDSRQGQVAGGCECGNEPSGSIKCGEFLVFVDLLSSQEGFSSVELVFLLFCSDMFQDRNLKHYNTRCILPYPYVLNINCHFSVVYICMKPVQLNDSCYFFHFAYEYSYFYSTFNVLS
jgi:hypothetical protein